MHSGTIHHIMLSLFHIFLVSPLLITVGLMRGTTTTTLYNILLGTGLLVLLYHLYRLGSKWISNHRSLIWINIMHILIIAPLLIYIGYMKEYTYRFAYELLLMLGFSAIGYHLYSLVVYIQSVDHNTELSS